jgi:hypothetical protein
VPALRQSSSAIEIAAHRELQAPAAAGDAFHGGVSRIARGAQQQGRCRQQGRHCNERDPREEPVHRLVHSNMEARE